MLNAAWDANIPVASENALNCHDREGYNKILENAKPLNDPDGRHLSAFTYLRLSPVLMERHNFLEFERFVKKMHGTFLLLHRHAKALDFSFYEVVHLFFKIFKHALPKRTSSTLCRACVFLNFHNI